MYLQRPSSERSQDVSHVLAKTFRELFTRDVIGADMIRNLSVSKGGPDQYHERYVTALQEVNYQCLTYSLDWFSIHSNQSVYFCLCHY
jgi:hypothetical protein